MGSDAPVEQRLQVTRADWHVAGTLCLDQRPRPCAIGKADAVQFGPGRYLRK
jgi:hypothetical protein